ncbi:hypothetical protein GCM10025734_29360 [Kitasatospora paranensis]
MTYGRPSGGPSSNPPGTGGSSVVAWSSGPAAGEGAGGPGLPGGGWPPGAGTAGGRGGAGGGAADSCLRRTQPPAPPRAVGSQTAGAVLS